MYQVEVYHHDKDWVRGDLEDKFDRSDICYNKRTDSSDS